MDELTEPVTYDRARLRVLLQAVVAGRGSLHWAETGGRSSAILMPRGTSCGPILITVVDEEAMITAGTGARFSSSPGEPGDESHLAQVVEAIVNGGATECAWFDATDGVYRTDVEIVGPGWSYTIDDEPGIIERRRLEPWPVAGAAE